MAAKSAPKKNLSALKRARQAEKRNERNRAERSRVKSAAKAVESAISAGNKDDVQPVLLTAIKTISSARSKGIIHKNNAARKISKLTKKANAALKAETA